MILFLLDEPESQYLIWLYETHKVSMKHYARILLRDPFLADDIIHTVMVNVIRNVKTVQRIAENQLPFFLSACIRNACIDVIRKNKRHSHNADIYNIWDNGIESEYESMEGYREIIEMIGGLPELTKDAASMRLILDMDYCEIAQIMDITEQTARKRVSRGRLYLQREIQSRQREVSIDER